MSKYQVILMRYLLERLGDIMMYEIHAKFELSPRQECIPEDIIREDLARKLAEQLKDKIIVFTRLNPLTGKLNTVLKSYLQTSNQKTPNSLKLLGVSL